jgi:hypothetical protein
MFPSKQPTRLGSSQHINSIGFTTWFITKSWKNNSKQKILASSSTHPALSSGGLSPPRSCHTGRQGRHAHRWGLPALALGAPFSHAGSVPLASGPAPRASSPARRVARLQQHSSRRPWLCGRGKRRDEMRRKERKIERRDKVLWVGGDNKRKQR